MADHRLAAASRDVATVAASLVRELLALACCRLRWGRPRRWRRSSRPARAHSGAARDRGRGEGPGEQQGERSRRGRAAPAGPGACPGVPGQPRARQRRRHGRLHPGARGCPTPARRWDQGLDHRGRARAVSRRCSSSAATRRTTRPPTRFRGGLGAGSPRAIHLSGYDDETSRALPLAPAARALPRDVGRRARVGRHGLRAAAAHRAALRRQEPDRAPRAGARRGEPRTATRSCARRLRELTAGGRLRGGVAADAARRRAGGQRPAAPCGPDRSRTGRSA